MDRAKGGAPAFGRETAVAYPADPEDGHSRGASSRVSSPGIEAGPRSPGAGGGGGASGGGGGPFVWWPFESRWRGGWAVFAFGWCLCALAWFILGATGVVRSRIMHSKWATISMFVPVPLTLALHFVETVAHRSRTVVLTRDTVAFPAHGFTARVVELPLSEILAVQLRAPPLLSLLRSSWGVKGGRCCDSLCLQHRTGRRYSISAFYLPSNEEFNELRRCIEGAVACH